MISYIVDGFDPWQNVEELLKSIADETREPYEILLVASRILDVQLYECKKKGRAIAGEAFHFIPSDEFSIARSRLAAQARAKGDEFVYLSPVVHLPAGVIANLLEARRVYDANPVISPLLAFTFPDGSQKRVLAHGFAISPDGDIIPLLEGNLLDSNIVSKNLQSVYSNPWCFYSRRPFYTQADFRGIFRQFHVAACVRNGTEGMSIGSAAVFLRPDNFFMYLKHVLVSKYDFAATLKQAAAKNGLQISMNACGKLRTDLVRQASLCHSEDDSESIFWDLLHDPLPEKIASALNAVRNKPLPDLAGFFLMQFAGITWKDALDKARKYLPQNNPAWQSPDLWQVLYQPLSDSIYAVEQPDIWKAIKNAKSVGAVLNNLKLIVSSVIFGWRFGKL